MVTVHRCTFVIVSSSKFFLDKFSGYSQQETSNITGAIYLCGLFFAAVAGALIVRTWTRVPLWILTNGGARGWGLSLCCLQDFVGLRAVILLLCAILMVPVLTFLAFTNIPPLVCTIWMGIVYSFVVVSLDLDFLRISLEMRKILQIFLFYYYYFCNY